MVRLLAQHKRRPYPKEWEDEVSSLAMKKKNKKQKEGWRVRDGCLTETRLSSLTWQGLEWPWQRSLYSRGGGGREEGERERGRAGEEDRTDHV